MALSAVSSLEPGREQRLRALCCFKDSGCVPPARVRVDARLLRTGPAFLEDALALPDSFVLPFLPPPSDWASASWPSPCLNLNSAVPSPRAARSTSCPLSPAPCAHLLSLPCQCATAVPVTSRPARRSPLPPPASPAQLPLWEPHTFPAACTLRNTARPAHLVAVHVVCQKEGKGFLTLHSGRAALDAVGNARCTLQVDLPSARQCFLFEKKIKTKGHLFASPFLYPCIFSPPPSQ